MSIILYGSIPVFGTGDKYDGCICGMAVDSIHCGDRVDYKENGGIELNPNGKYVSISYAHENERVYFKEKSL